MVGACHRVVRGHPPVDVLGIDRHTVGVLPGVVDQQLIDVRSVKACPPNRVILPGQVELRPVDVLGVNRDAGWLDARPERDQRLIDPAPVEIGLADVPSAIAGRPRPVDVLPVDRQPPLETAAGNVEECVVHAGSVEIGAPDRERTVHVVLPIDVLGVDGDRTLSAETGDEVWIRA